MAIIAFVAATLASGISLFVDRIVFRDDAATELRREDAQRKSDEASAQDWMTRAHAPGSPLNR